MKARSTKLSLEVLEDRCVPATVVYADFNHDGHMDKAEVTAPTTVTVSLAKPDGSYAASAILTVPKNQPISDIGVYDYGNDGNMDLYASSPGGGAWTYTTKWSGNGDGTFDFLSSGKWRWPPKGNFEGF